MRKFGLIGYPLGHSFSKGYFSEKFFKEKISDCEYNNYQLEQIEDISNLINSEPYLCGLNVTIPYKKSVIPFLQEIDHNAKDIGAVNTILVTRSEGKITLKGFNTDVYGFEQPLLEVLKPSHKKALILGTGGASKAVAWILKNHQIQHKFVSRKPVNESIFSYQDLTKQIIADYQIIINTSPTGMYPEVSAFPDIPYDGVGAGHILYDLIYNPEKTEFLKIGEGRRAIIINGLPMLQLQAEKSWEIWNSTSMS